MKKFVSTALCFFVFLSFPFAAGAKDLPNVSAEAYVLYCVDNGETVACENENRKMKPASTTKLMTTLITLEQAAKGNKTVTFTEDMIAEGSSMYLKLGEKVTLRDLATGMMMSSGNDAANAAALSIADSFEGFAKLMNERARQIGMKNTGFVTPSGLDDENHYSTAYDLALLMSAAIQNKDFADLTSRKSMSVDFVEPSDKHVTYSNHNRLLSLYEYCIGGKTGYTMSAGRCLVSAAKKDGLTLVCVTLNDRNDWNDHISLYDYGFSKLALYRSDDSAFCADIPCAGGKKDTIAVMGGRSVSIVLNAGDEDKIERKVFIDSFLYAPVKEGDTVGRIDYTLNGEVLDSVELDAVESVEIRKVKKSIFQKIKDLFTNG